MNVKTTLSLVRVTVPSTRSASDGCVLFLLAAAAAMPWRCSRVWWGHLHTHSHTFLWVPSSLNSHRPFLFWVSEKRSERNFSCLREWKTHSRGMQSRLLQRLSSTSTLVLSSPLLSIFHLLLTPTVTIHTHTHTYSPPCVCLSLLRRAVSVSWWPCLCADVMGNSCCISLLAVFFFLFSLLPFHPSLFLEITGWWVYDPFFRTSSVRIFCGWSFIDKRSSFTDLLWNVSTAVFEEKQMMITFWFPILYFL